MSCTSGVFLHSESAEHSSRRSTADPWPFLGAPSGSTNPLLECVCWWRDGSWRVSGKLLLVHYCQALVRQEKLLSGKTPLIAARHAPVSMRGAASFSDAFSSSSTLLLILSPVTESPGKPAFFSIRATEALHSTKSLAWLSQKACGSVLQRRKSRSLFRLYR